MPLNEKGIEALETILAENESSLLFARLAGHYLEEGELDKALPLIEKGIQNHPDFFPGLLVHASVLFQMNELDEAHDAFRRVLDEDARCLSAIRFLGEIHSRQNSVDEAEVQIRELQRLDPLGPNYRLSDVASGEEESLAPEETETSELDSGELSQALDSLFGDEEFSASPEGEVETPEESFIEKTPEDIPESIPEEISKEIPETSEASTSAAIDSAMDGEKAEQQQEDVSKALDELFGPEGSQESANVATGELPSLDGGLDEGVSDALDDMFGFGDDSDELAEDEENEDARTEESGTESVESAVEDSFGGLFEDDSWDESAEEAAENETVENEIPATEATVAVELDEPAPTEETSESTQSAEDDLGLDTLFDDDSWDESSEEESSATAINEDLPLPEKIPVFEESVVDEQAASVEPAEVSSEGAETVEGLDAGDEDDLGLDDLFEDDSLEEEVGELSDEAVVDVATEEAVESPAEVAIAESEELPAPEEQVASVESSAIAEVAETAEGLDAGDEDDLGLDDLFEDAVTVPAPVETFYSVDGENAEGTILDKDALDTELEQMDVNLPIFEESEDGDEAHVEDGESADEADDMGMEDLPPPAEESPATATLAEIYLEQGLFEESIAIFQQLVDKDPSRDDLKERINEAKRRMQS